MFVEPEQHIIVFGRVGDGPVQRFKDFFIGLEVDEVLIAEGETYLFHRSVHFRFFPFGKNTRSSMG